MGSFQPMDRIQVFCVTGRFFTSWATGETCKCDLLVKLEKSLSWLIRKAHTKRVIILHLTTCRSDTGSKKAFSFAEKLQSIIKTRILTYQLIDTKLWGVKFEDIDFLIQRLNGKLKGKCRKQLVSDSLERYHQPGNSTKVATPWQRSLSQDVQDPGSWVLSTTLALETWS